MAKVTKSENGQVAAANDYIPDAILKIGKHHDTLVSHIETTEAKLVESNKALADEKAAGEKAAKAAEEKYNRDTTALQGRLTVAEDKIRKVFGTVSQ